MKYLNDVSYKDCVGKVCKSKSSGDFKIVKYNNARDVEVQFLKTKFEMTVELGSIRNGNVKDPYSPSVKHKLEVYEVQDSVYLYNSLDELKEIYELLGEPHIVETYEKSEIDNLVDSLQHNYGLLHYWEDYDSEWDFTYKYMKVIDGACVKGEM